MLSEELLGQLIIGFSLGGAVLASTNAFVDPSRRWHHLRGAAVALESEIWKFRTRSGKYAMNHKDETISNGPTMLLAALEEVKQHVTKSASIGGTRLFSSFELFGTPSSRARHHFTHGQYKGCKTEGTHGRHAKMRPQRTGVRRSCFPCHRKMFKTLPGEELDDHHSPINAEKYIRFRVEPVCRFYQARLPRYHRFKTFTTYFLVLGSLSGTLMSFLNVEKWTAMVAAMTGLITAWCVCHDHLP